MEKRGNKTSWKFFWKLHIKRQIKELYLPQYLVTESPHTYVCVSKLMVSPMSSHCLVKLHIAIQLGNNFSFFLFFLLFPFFKNCCVIIVVPNFPPLSPPPYPSPLPTFNLPPTPCLCPWVLHACSLMTLPLLSHYPLSPSPLVTVSLFFVSMSLVLFYSLVCFVN